MPEPFATPSARMETVAPLSAVPEKLGVVLLVMLSVAEVPVSVAASRSGIDGAAGAVVSIMTDKAELAVETFVALSVAVAVIDLVPDVRAEVVMVYAPPEDAYPVPTLTPPFKIVTSEFPSAVPEKVGVVSLVMSSVLEEPESLAESRLGTDGEAGAAVSIENKATAETQLRGAPGIPLVVDPAAWAPDVAIEY